MTATGWDRDYDEGDRVKRIWNREGTVINIAGPSTEGGPEYLVRWDGIGDPEWMKSSSLEKGMKPQVSEDHEHRFEFETRDRRPPFFLCRCGEFLSWEEAQERLNQP